jgi:hypothetical protein
VLCYGDGMDPSLSVELAMMGWNVRGAERRGV